MDFLPLGDVELHYTSLEFLDYGVGGQHYGTLDGGCAGGCAVNCGDEGRAAAPRHVDLPDLAGLLRRRTTRWSTSR